MTHVPVLQKEVLSYLDPRPNENFIDATLGEGGHSLAILERILPNGQILGIDWSPELIKSFKSRISNLQFRKNFILVCDNFANLEKIVKKYKFKKVAGILFDLGLSSWHLEKSKRGFSFLKDERLDMRYNPEILSLTAEKILNFWPQEKIEEILKEYGQELFAKRIAKKIIQERKIQPIKTTFQLREIIKKAVPRKYQLSKFSFLSRSFQALRIAVNDELNNLKKALSQTLAILKPEGKLVIISFHSLEDGIVKNFFKNQAKEGWLKILTKKPIRPTEKEIKINPRARSAKLRAALKYGKGPIS